VKFGINHWEMFNILGNRPYSTNYDRGVCRGKAVDKSVESVNNFLHMLGIQQLWKLDFVNRLSKGRTFWGKMAAGVDFIHSP
jgi:hypothetical protein